MTCAVLATLPFGASAATAAGAEADNWWYDVYDVGTVHTEGWTGEGVKIAVVDQQINPDLPVFSGTNLSVSSEPLCTGGSPISAEPTVGASHGTTITASIIGNGSGAGAVRGIAPGADVTFYGYGNNTDSDDCTLSEYDGQLSGFGLGVQRAIDDGARIVTTSVAGGGVGADAEVIANALAKGVIVISATTNPTTPGLRDDRRNSLNGILTAAAVDRQGNLQTDRDGAPDIITSTTVVAAGVGLPTVGVAGESWDTTALATGSSFAAPLVAGMLAVAAQRYPDASSDQLVQALLHTTGGEAHELEHDPASGYGYGAAWLTSLLATDPAQYPDENPLMDKGDEPTVEQVAAAAARGSSYPPAGPDSFGAYGDDEAATAPAVDGMMPLLLVVIAVLGLVVVGGVITIVIVVSRKKKTPQGGTA